MRAASSSTTARRATTRRNGGGRGGLLACVASTVAACSQPSPSDRATTPDVIDLAVSGRAAARPEPASPPGTDAAGAGTTDADLPPAEARRRPPDDPIAYPIRGRATCGGKQRCPVDKPICALSADATRCVARGTPDYLEADIRFGCTRQSDCENGDGCFHVVGEADFPVNADCGRWPGYAIPAVCDTTSDHCDPDADPTCVVCKPAPAAITERLPWLGVW